MLPWGRLRFHNCYLPVSSGWYTGPCQFRYSLAVNAIKCATCSSLWCVGHEFAKLALLGWIRQAYFSASLTWERRVQKYVRITTSSRSPAVSSLTKVHNKYKKTYCFTHGCKESRNIIILWICNLCAKSTWTLILFLYSVHVSWCVPPTCKKKANK